MTILLKKISLHLITFLFLVNAMSMKLLSDNIEKVKKCMIQKLELKKNKF